MPARLRLVLLLLSVGMAGLPFATLAQDVIVWPTAATTAAADTASTTTTTPDNPTAAPAPPATAQTAPPDAAPVKPKARPALAAVPAFNQCTTDADCVIATDGCMTVAAVNKDAAPGWVAALPKSHCAASVTQAIAQLRSKAVCHDQLCGLTPTSQP